MFDADRFRDLLARRDISQSELARRVGISQASIYRLAAGDAYGSKHLHRIARELGTTPAYLTGETDDPASNAADIPPLDSETRGIVENLSLLRSSNRRAIADVVRSLAELGKHAASPSIPELPSEEALAEMFEALLEGISPETSLIERAQLLAQRLPIGLSQLHDVQPDTDSRSPAGPGRKDRALPAKRQREPQP